MTGRFNELEKETIFGQVVSKANNYQVGDNKHGDRYIIKSEEVRRYERSFFEQCKIYRDRGIDRAFTFYMIVYESSNRYDLDNAPKIVLDCLQTVGAITNDNLCVGLHLEKHIDRANPRIIFAIEEHEPNLFR